MQGACQSLVYVCVSVCLFRLQEVWSEHLDLCWVEGVQVAHECEGELD